MHSRQRRLAVVGHVEWVQFARVSHVPQAGEVVHASHAFEEPAGGGAVAAVQLARLSGDSLLLTALGDDHLGERSQARLRELGVHVRAATRSAPTRRALTLLDEHGERTITTIGPRLEASGAEELGWQELADADGVYFTAGDSAALRAARAARVLVASPRARDALGHGVTLDAIVMSAEDQVERRAAERVGAQASLLVFTEGERGGTYLLHGQPGSFSAQPPPGPPVDSYGCGDSFAAGLTYGLALGMEVPAALELAARCGAVCATGHGPYQAMLSGAAA